MIQDLLFRRLATAGSRSERANVRSIYTPIDDTLELRSHSQHYDEDLDMIANEWDRRRTDAPSPIGAPPTCHASR